MDWKSINKNYNINEDGTEVVSRGRRGNKREGNMVKIRNSKSGYKQVFICNEGKMKGFQVHRLVYSLFVGDIPYGYDIHHIDGDKYNNHYSNLEPIEHGKHTSFHKLGFCYHKPTKIKIKKNRIKTQNKTYDMKAYQLKWRLEHPNYQKDRRMKIVCKSNSTSN